LIYLDFNSSASKAVFVLSESPLKTEFTPLNNLLCKLKIKDFYLTGVKLLALIVSQPLFKSRWWMPWDIKAMKDVA